MLTSDTLPLQIAMDPEAVRLAEVLLQQIESMHMGHMQLVSMLRPFTPKGDQLTPQELYAGFAQVGCLFIDAVKKARERALESSSADTVEMPVFVG